jgi:alkanesulfonate monooxygenase SsuD/methylene tetrahydromethanopterin reductase-like flavin-dependent oxidoreductase (luciferase family)
VKFGYGLITCQRPPDDPRTDAEIYRDAIERAERAEAVGLDSAWVSEHHFLDDGYMPSLLVMCAAIAQATSTITIGTAVLLAPLYHPLRLAEDAATVDLISNGRLILGIGAGWRPEEFDIFGTPLDTRGKRMRDTVRILREAWSAGLTTSGDGGVNVTPKPAHDIPIWLGGFAPGAIKRAGRIADGFLGSSSGTSGIEAFKQAKQLAIDARGNDDFSFALHVPVYIGDWDDVKQHYHYLRWKYPDMGAARGSTVAKSPPPLTEEIEQQLRPTIICGSETEVRQQVDAFRDALGDDTHLICRSDFPGMPQAQSLELIDRLGSLL